MMYSYTRIVIFFRGYWKRGESNAIYLILWMKVSKFRWESITPFGKPVVPLEQRMTAILLSLSPTCTGVNVRGSTIFPYFSKNTFNVTTFPSRASSSNSINFISQLKVDATFTKSFSVRRDTNITRGW